MILMQNNQHMLYIHSLEICLSSIMQTKVRLFMFLMITLLVTFSFYLHFGIQSTESVSPSKQMIIKFVDFLNNKLDMNRQSSSIWWNNYETMKKMHFSTGTVTRKNKQCFRKFRIIFQMCLSRVGWWWRIRLMVIVRVIVGAQFTLAYLILNTGTTTGKYSKSLTMLRLLDQPTICMVHTLVRWEILEHSKGNIPFYFI